jgi:hypothetical protein
MLVISSPMRVAHSTMSENGVGWEGAERTEVVRNLDGRESPLPS